MDNITETRIVKIKIIYNYVILYALIFLVFIGCSSDIKLKDGWSDPILICYRSDYDYVLSDLNNGRSIVADNSNNVHIVFRRREKNSQGQWGNFNLYCKRLIPISDGMRPGKDIFILNDANASNPSIAVDFTGGIHLVYESIRQNKSYIFTCKSLDGGKTWTDHTFYIPTENGGKPSIAIDLQNKIHITYRTRSCIKYLKKTINGNIIVDTALHSVPEWLGSTYHSSITSDDSNRIHIAWSLNIIGWSNDINYIRSSDNSGYIWSQVLNIGRTLSYLPSPLVSICTDNQNGVYIFWNGISYRRSTNGGVSWDSVITIASGNRPSVAADVSGKLHVVYENEGAIFYTYSNDRGSTWFSPIRLSDQEVNTARSPFIAIDGAGRKHIIWQQYDEKDQVNCLYYKFGR